MPMPPLHRRSERDRIETAYLILLTLHFGAARAMLQPALATLRDTLAEITGDDAETIQNHFEATAAKQPLHLQ